MEIEKSVLSSEDTSIALTYNAIGVVFEKLGQYEKALEYHFQANSILPPGTIEFALVFDNIGLVYEKLGLNEKALEYHQKALDMEKTILSRNSLVIATTYNNIGVVYGNLGKFDDALFFHNLALKIRRKKSRSSAEIATTYDCMGVILQKKGRFKDALPYHMKALAIRDNLLIPEEPDLAITHDNIGSCYGDLGQYSNAIKYHKQALTIAKKVLPEHHLIIGTIHDNLGVVYSDLGQYESALNHHKIALNIRKSILRSDSSDLAISYDNIGSIYSDLRLYKQALEYHNKALKIRKKRIIQNNLDIIISYNHLGVINEELGLFDMALAYHKKALRIRKRMLPEDSLDIATSLINVGVVYCGIKQYSKAIVSFNKALRIQKKTLDSNSPDIATLYNNKGIAYFGLNKYEEALDCHTKALSIRNRIFTPGNFDIALSLHNVIYLYQQLGKSEKVIEFAMKLASLLPKMYVNIMKVVNETLRLNQMRSLYSHIYLIHSISSFYKNKIKHTFLYDVLIKSKDLNAEVNFIMNSYLSDKSPDSNELRQLWDKLAQREQLLIIKSKYRDIEIIDNEINKLEQNLIPLVKEINFKHRMLNMTAQSVIKTIPKDSALLEYGWYFCDESFIDKQNEDYSVGKYYVFLLINGKISLHYLENDAEIHKTLNRVRDKIKADKNINHLEKDTKEGFQSLYNSLIAPIIGKIYDVKHIYIAPDGELYKLPFELLLDEKEVKLSDKYGISYLSSGRDFIRQEKFNSSFPDYKKIAILAEHLYDFPDEIGNSNDNEKQSKHQNLEFALTEAYSLYKIFSRSKTTIYGIKANKYALKELESNDIIHIITHGFYNEVKESPKTFSKDSLTTQHYISEDPLINSGLVFTNVNDRSEFPNNKFEDAFGDCILSAKEVLSMDLHGTDLLILSACQTALGDHRNGEGIQGLRRAFELAGVNSIICTLWDVSDISSAILMEKFYYNLIKKRMNKAQSLYYAKEYVKKFTNKDTIKYFKKNGFISKADELEEYCEIHESLKQKPFEHPYYWAGYILQGCI